MKKEIYLKAVTLRKKDIIRLFKTAKKYNITQKDIAEVSQQTQVTVSRVKAFGSVSQQKAEIVLAATIMLAAAKIFGTERVGKVRLCK